MGRPLFAMLIAVAMLFAPLAMRSGSAMAMAPAADHHDQMTQSGHCDEQPAEDKDDRSGDRCVAMCTAIAVADVRPIEPQVLRRPADRPGQSEFRHGFLAKLPTPPPRPV